MELIKEHINEKFAQESDPIQDMGIGMRHKIKEWLKNFEEKHGKDSYIIYPKITEKLFINVLSADISWNEYSDIPNYIKFGLVDKSFSCCFGEKDHLYQLPKYVGGKLSIFPYKHNKKDIDFTIDDVLKYCKVKPENIFIYKDASVGNSTTFVLVEESLNEKFTEDSDPIQDMGIGMIEQWKKIKEKLWNTVFGELQNKYFKSYEKFDNGMILEEIICDVFLYLSEKILPQQAFNKAFIKNGVTNKDVFVDEKRKIMAKVLLKHFGIKVDPSIKHVKRTIKESLNEKFTEDSDPIHDMGIGIMYQIEKWLKIIDLQHIINNKNLILEYAVAHGKITFVKYLLEMGADVHSDDDDPLLQACLNNRLEIAKILLDAGADVHAQNNRFFDIIKRYNYHELDRLFKEYQHKRKKIKESLNEKFTEDSDPIKDMEIGQTHQIKKWFEEEHGKRFTNNDDLFIACVKYNRPDWVHYLLNLNFSQQTLDAALRMACIWNNEITVRILLDAGADPTQYESVPLRLSYHYPNVQQIIWEYILKNKQKNKNIYKKNNENMRAKYVYEVLKEGYGAGFSMSSGGRFSGGMGGTSRGGFGGSWNAGGPSTMYTYEIKPLNHTLEQLPTVTNDQVEQIQIGSKISGTAVRSNATPEKKEVTGIVHKIVTTDNGAIKYYIVQDEATATEVKLEPLGVKLIIAEPIQYYFDATDTIPTRRKGKKIRNA